MLRWHRLCALLTALLVVHIIWTGTGIQLADMRALVTHAPATDPDMEKMWQHHAGPPNFLVRQAPDFAAAPLPGGIDYASELEKTAALGRKAAPGAPMKLVELRMAGTVPAGHVQMGDKHLIFDLASGTPLPEKFLPPPPLPYEFAAPRQTFKRLHRFAFIPIGSWSTTFDLISGIALAILTVTGFIHYYRVYRARAKMKRNDLFWKGGSWWRQLHRWLSLGSAALLVWLLVTGLLLSINNVGQNIHWLIVGHPGKSPEQKDMSSPLSDGELASMASTSIDAFHRAEPDTALKVLRLRYFAGYAQGVIVAADADTTQLVFNAKTGARMTMSEPGYPDVGYVFEWEGNQVLKRLHRGDSLGMAGRWLITLGALAMCYLAISGLVMYYQDWTRRRRTGRGALIWK
ncbi:PepSY domain-containing protein [Novosphingobium flavum]|uniref:PepSY domain-containing protein n=1 Tax=Novosphingobium flavum TaxID=1778672 RepID=A0A7X1FSE7_9SPHN|nr:PepSY-associated TM helix domain-containing protein [Novosphingobium flavum]MBC2666100.1 PepSY domain-containing protein [Novosphingobium flavum]